MLPPLLIYVFSSEPTEDALSSAPIAIDCLGAVLMRTVRRKEKPNDTSFKHEAHTMKLMRWKGRREPDSQADVVY